MSCEHPNSFERMYTRTMSAQFQVQDIANADVYHAQESLIPSLELPLIENLNRNDGRILDNTTDQTTNMRLCDDVLRVESHIHIEVLVPVGVQGLLYHTRGVRLVCINGENREGVGESKNVAFGLSIGRND